MGQLGCARPRRARKAAQLRGPPRGQQGRADHYIHQLQSLSRCPACLACQALCSCSEDSVPVGKPMLPSRALGVLVSTCGALLLHRHGSGVSCQTSSAQHYEVADCPAPQRVRRSSRQTCHPVHRIHQTAARILKGVPAHCITSQIPDHCERCHEPAGRVRRRATRADVIGLAGPSPVNSYDLWRDDIRVMRELGVKARPSL